MSEFQQIRLTVNGQEMATEARPSDTLLTVLRDRLHMTGTKVGCGIGYCGACTVLLDDLAVHSCCVLAGTVEDRRITTIEGLASDGHLNAVQAAFVNEGAIQCGYCTSGFVISATALLRATPTPDEAHIRRFLVGNICRCTGYSKIVKAILTVAAANKAAGQ